MQSSELHVNLANVVSLQINTYKLLQRLNYQSSPVPKSPTALALCLGDDVTGAPP